MSHLKTLYWDLPSSSPYSYIHIVELERPQMTVWCMRTACWIPKAANPRSEYVILFFSHCSNGCTNTPQCYVTLHCRHCLTLQKRCAKWLMIRRKATRFASVTQWTVRAVTYIRDSNQSFNLQPTCSHVSTHIKNIPINSFYIFRQLGNLLNF
jgi:hypothetical protein